MDVLANVVPHGTREEWFLEIIGLLVVVLLATVVRLGAPKARRPRLRSLAVLLVLNVLSFLGAEAVAYKHGRSVLGGLAIVFIALALARGAFLLGFDVLIARNRRDPLPRIVRDLAQGGILIVAALISMPAAGIEPGQILTTSALLTVVAGMALQETLGNLVAGLAIQTERPFEVGDWIEVHGTPGHIGRVREINWRATRLHTLDNVDVVVPNGLLAKATFTNYDRPHRAARRSVYFNVPLSVPTRLVHDTVLPAIKDAPGVLATPAPSLVTYAFNESGVSYWLRFFIDDMSRRDGIDGGVRDRIWYALARIGVTLSVPNRHLTMVEATESTERARLDRAVEARLETLASHELFAQLPPDDLRRLAERARTVRFAPTEAVIRQGEVGSEMFVVKRGRLAVRIGTEARRGPPGADGRGERGEASPESVPRRGPPGEGGAETEVARLGEGALLGEMSLLTGDPRRATIAAVDEVELVAIDQAAFRDLLATNPAVVQLIGAKVAQRNAELAASTAGATVEEAKVAEASDALVDRIRRFFRL